MLRLEGLLGRKRRASDLKEAGAVPGCGAWLFAKVLVVATKPLMLIYQLA
jgi:hypothetical protein